MHAHPATAQARNLLLQGPPQPARCAGNCQPEHPAPEAGRADAAARVARWSRPTTGSPRIRLRTPLDRANFRGLVLGCIEAKFCKKICVGKLSPRSTQCTPLHRSQCSKFRSKIAENFANFFVKFYQIFTGFSPNFAKFSLDVGQNLPEFCRIFRIRPRRNVRGPIRYP